MTLEAIRWSEDGPRARLQLLDQRRLPLETEFIDVAGPEEGWHAIKDMAVRGAPAIAIAGALALAVQLQNDGAGAQFRSAQDAQQSIAERLDYLVTSRPTAVNLADAAQKLGQLARETAAAPGASGASVATAVIAACKQMLLDDVAANQAMGQHGADGILAELARRGREGRRVRLLTHCNTGSLATAGFGTALGVVRALAARGAVEHVYCTETRPYNQGSRLTAYELVHDGLPATLIADSAAAALLAAGRVDAIVVGADRVAANGDTANKIGTQSLAVLASHFSVPFYVAAPTTTLDPHLASGERITIEEREPAELTHLRGARMAAPGINVWNPAFDVAPGALITGIATERGVIPRAPGGAFDVPGWLAGSQAGGGGGVAGKGAGSKLPGFYALDTETVKEYLAEHPQLAARLGPVEGKADWKVREVGDGNINFVYIVEGPEGALVLKQGLPYIRIATDWPLTQERVALEAAALAEQAAHCPAHVPTLHHADARMALLVMQFLPPPHDILRRALGAGRTFPLLAAHVAAFLARTLFATSLLALDSATFREKAARFSNSEMCRLTEQVIFTDPYYAAPPNRHTSPQLDGWAAAFRRDAEAKAAATRLKALFVERQQALLHGDLHTGSFMVTADSTYAIDAEFACCGPMAFDCCKMPANLLLAFFAADGQAAAAGGSRVGQQAWLLETVEGIWDGFRERFLALWDEAVASGTAGDLCHPGLFPADEARAPDAQVKALQAAFMAELLRDTLAFAGAVMIRRVLGIAHVIDFESIQDADARAACEARALKLGRELLVHPARFASIQAVTALAKRTREEQRPEPPQ